MRYKSALMVLALISTDLSAQENEVGAQIQHLQSLESGQQLLKRPDLKIESVLGGKLCPNCLPPGNASFSDIAPIYAELEVPQINNNLLRNQTEAILSLKKSIDALEKRISALEKGNH